jgi:hypothetical protein
MTNADANLATLIALLDEAVSNHLAVRRARGREMRERYRARNQRMRAASRQMRKGLTRDKRLEYEAWVARCKNLTIPITTRERFEYLSELSNIRRAA